MDCLKSFTLTIKGNENVSPPQSKFWGSAPQNYWSAETGFVNTSLFEIEGFKNINIYRIKAVGNVVSANLGSNAVIVQDWNFFIKIKGQMQFIGGNIRTSPNGYSMTTFNNDPIFSVSKFNSLIEFKDPIISAKTFEVLGLETTGIGAQNLSVLNLNWFVTFIIYYQFEGEEIAFL